MKPSKRQHFTNIISERRKDMKRVMTIIIIFFLIGIVSPVLYNTDQDNSEVSVNRETEHGPKDWGEKHERRSEELNVDIVKNHLKITETQGGFTGNLDSSDFFGDSVSNLGDLDGDGVTDIAVGARNDDDGGANHGAIWILFLNNNGTIKVHQKISDTQGGFTGDINSSDSFGSSVSNLGDLDGDSVTDIAVGACLDDDGGANHGAIWILFLNNNGTVKSHQKISDTQGGFTGTLDDDAFGKSVTDIGDLDGDGVTDIAVGAHWDDDGQWGNSDTGAVWILFLRSNGTVKSQQKISPISGGFNGTLNNGDYFGWSISNLGDLDGDGVTDIAMGALQDDDGGANHGAIWILFLNNNGTVKSHQKISDTQGGFTGTLDDGSFGYSVSDAGDLDGDGITDIAVGAPCHRANRGAVWILFLNSNGTVKSHQKISDVTGGFNGTLNNGDFFGCSVSSIGDIDGDDNTDIVVGARYDGGSNMGAIWILFLNDKPNFGAIWNSSLTTGDSCIFFTNITDNMNGINEVWFNFTINSGNSHNWSVVNRTGNSWSIGLTLPDNAISIEYYFWASDTTNYYNKTINDTLIVTDNDKPTLIRDNSLDMGYTGDTFTFDINVSDNIGVASSNISWSHGGLHSNLQVANDGDGTWSGSITLDHNLEDLTYYIQINDSAGNSYNSPLQTVTVTDNDDPILISDDSLNQGTTGDTFTFDISVSDNIGVASANISWSHGGLHGNLQVADDGDGTWSGSITLDHNLEDLTYYTKINDSAGNSYNGALQTVTITDNDKPKYIPVSEPISGATGEATFVSYIVNDNIGVVSGKINILGTLYDMTNNKSYYNYTINIPSYSVNSISYNCTYKDEADNQIITPNKIITVVDNDPPIAEIGEDILIDQHQEATFNGTNSSDNIGIEEFRWSFNYNGIEKTLKGEDVNFTFDIPGIYPITLNISDEEGNWATDFFNVTVRDITPPSADAAHDIIVDQHQTVTFNGNKSSDNVGIINFTWKFLYDDELIILEGINTDYLFNIAGTYLVTLNVSDVAGNWDNDTLFVTVNDITKPVANAGSEQTVEKGSIVILNGNNSSDNVAIVSFIWTFDYNSVEKTLYGSEQPFVFNTIGNYVITLTVTDGAGNFDTDTTIIKVLEQVVSDDDSDDDTPEKRDDEKKESWIKENFWLTLLTALLLLIIILVFFIVIIRRKRNKTDGDRKSSEDIKSHPDDVQFTERSDAPKPPNMKSKIGGNSWNVKVEKPDEISNFFKEEISQTFIVHESINCQICFGYIKPGGLALRCSCGKTYHPVCALRLGNCPICSSEFSKEVIGIDFVEGFEKEIDEEVDDGEEREFRTFPVRERVHCKICFGKINLQCKCGKIYHPHCAARVTECPICEAIITEADIDIPDEDISIDEDTYTHEVQGPRIYDPEIDFEINDVFLIYIDGRLIKSVSFSSSIREEIDEDILGGMLTAVKSFVGDSFKEESGGLKTLQYGKMTIFLERGVTMYLALVFRGPSPDDLRKRMRTTLIELWKKYKDSLKVWDGSYDGLDNIGEDLAKNFGFGNVIWEVDGEEGIPDEDDDYQPPKFTGDILTEEPEEGEMPRVVTTADVSTPVGCYHLYNMLLAKKGSDIRIGPDSLKSEISKARKQIIIMYHPDRWQKDKDKANFFMKKVNVAWEVLSKK